MSNISFEQAAALPCAGTTAWNALFEVGVLRPGQTVLTIGTGGLSLIALSLAKAAGAFVGITSSDDDRLEQAKELGADFGINYKNTPDWHEAVRAITQGVGADVILENAGPPSIAASVKCAAQEGRVCQIGWKGLDGPAINPLDMAMSGVSVVPIQGGSGRMLERLVKAVAVNNITVPIAHTFLFDEAREAFDMLENGRAFGKVVVKGC